MEYSEANVTREMQISADQVIDAWLEPETFREWMTAALRHFGLPGDIRQLKIDARVGGRFFVSDMRDGHEQKHWGTYLELDHPRKLVFNWFASEEDERDGVSVVTLLVEPRETGCCATIEHRMTARDAELVERTALGWDRMLQEIENREIAHS